MALSATFKADFASFYEAVEKAEIKLVDFGAGADKVGTRLDRMADQFSGKKLIQEATMMAQAVEDIGGMSKFTEKELGQMGATAAEAVAKMKAIGMDVPKNIQAIADKAKDANKQTTDWMGTLTKVAGTIGIAFSVDAVVNFIGSIFDAAGAVKDLSDQWGVSTTFVQKWSAAARASGVEAETVGKTIQFVTEKLVDQTKEYDALLANIGLSGEALRGMSTEDAYREVVRGLSQIKDETLQLDAAAAILGPGYKKMIGTIRDGILEAADAQSAMSEQTIARLDAAGAAWGELKNKVVIYSGEMLASVMKDTATMTKSWGNFFAIAGLAIKDFATFQTGSVAAFIAIDQAADEAAKTANKYAHDINLSEKATNANGAAMETTAQIYARLRKETEDNTKAERDRTTAMAATKAAQETYTKTVEAQSKALGDLVDRFEGSDLIGKAKNYAQALEYSIPVQQMTRKAQDEINKVMDAAIEVYVAAGKTAPQVFLDIAKATEAAKIELLAVSKTFPALEGGIKSLGDAPLTSGLWGQIKDVKVAGQFDGMGKGMATAMGGSVMKALQGGGNIFQSAGSAIGDYLLDPEKSGVGGAIAKGAAKLPGVIGGAIGSMIPMVGPLIGPAVGFLTDKIAGMFGPSEAEKMRDNFIHAAGGIAELTKDANAAGVSLDRLMSAKDVEGVKASIAEIQEAVEFQENAFDKAREVAEKYGFTLEELGPAFARSDLDKKAAQLYSDFRTLWHAGVDQVALYERMSAGVNEYVNEALKMGFEVPNAMRDMLEQYAKSGKLIDANGEAITDLSESGIKFSMTLTEGFTSVVEAVQKLVQALDRDLNPALREVSKPRTIAFGWSLAKQPTGDPAEGFARGTNGFRDFGKGTPVVLHGWEAVVPKDDAGAFATVHGGGGGDTGGGGAAPAIIINAQGAFFDTPESLQRLANKVSDALTAKYSVMGKLRAAG